MVVTRNGEPVVVLISPAELQSIEATLEVLSDPAFRLAGFLAETAHSRAHPEENVSTEEMAAGYAHFRATGRWRDGWDV